MLFIETRFSFCYVIVIQICLSVQEAVENAAQNAGHLLVPDSIDRIPDEKPIRDPTAAALVWPGRKALSQPKYGWYAPEKHDHDSSRQAETATKNGQGSRGKIVHS